MPTAKNLGAKYTALFDHASDAILTLDGSGRVEDLNRAAEDLTGYLREELMGQKIERIFPDRARHHVPERSRPLDRERLGAVGTTEDVAVAGKDGLVKLVDLTVRRVREGQGEGLSLLLLRDVGEKKRMERELITQHAELRRAYAELEKRTVELQSMQETLVQAGKMAALGELAFGIAHELNQPLQAIRGYAQELEARLPGGDASVRSDLGEIASATEKMRKIIDHLRTHVRKSGEGHDWVELDSVVGESLKLLTRQLASHGIRVERELPEGLPRVYANALQLEQVFTNFLTNARDAIDATARGSGVISIRGRVDGSWVELVFADDGCGMSEKTKQKAFNPFFTTKEVGQGMGLGLSLSYGLISKLQGSIVVESELGKGTRIKVRIPKDFREMA